ncbi:palmitoyltransferase ZDHHC16-like isoform X2 [Biomphalaria glabrata]|uniref:Palmitoyltransferase n=1 Tax=Biomphalaria glabrata TaxID=6526 RepID=A0A9W2ZX47_BIOGL|nr:palmitoyltransferase ZDHHC16-like isoform X2 [Biomphalaria glabrata]
MALVHWKILEFPKRLHIMVKDYFKTLRIIYLSLCYNHFTTCSTVLDTACEPMFWIVDHTTRFMGPIMVTLVVLLTTMVVMVFYICIFPHIYYQKDILWSGFHLFFSHWLLMNIVFNYVMAAFTNPGHPSQNVSQVVSICRKCVAPKPPRTHHCTICASCVLKMDHHCPWLNNCVGFYNHRYFFQFVFYMWFGTVYTSLAGYDVFKQHFFGNKELVVPAFFFPVNMAYHLLTDKRSDKKIYSNMSAPMMFDSHKLANEGLEDDDIKATLEDQLIHNAIILQFLLCAGVAVALGLLGIWHARLISRGETSIEQHINKRERIRMRKKNLVYRNPYNFGFIKNWKMFLGLGKGRTFFRHILFPSCHDPLGDGIMWETVTFKLDRSPTVLDLL